MDELVAVAKIVRPRGLDGEVVAEVLTDFPDRFAGLEAVTGVRPDGKRIELTIEDYWFQRDRIVLKFAGCDSVESAESLRDCELCVAETEAVELNEGEFFEWQIEGCRVETAEGRPIGIVKEMQRTGGTENLLVESEERDYLIPFAKSICIEVDTENKLIRVDPPEGLLDF
jgi:16S rRNA processing protein RimM